MHFSSVSTVIFLPFAVGEKEEEEGEEEGLCTFLQLAQISPCCLLLVRRRVGGFVHFSTVRIVISRRGVDVLLYYGDGGPKRTLNAVSTVIFRLNGGGGGGDLQLVPQ